ncbi:MAG: glycosyltransferase [Elusimicrobia bacterium]|nr:glycosyltransferase [Elusimicrobiota bacterium]
MSKRLKVLIVAYACTPGRGSEPGIGWSIAAGLHAHHDVWLLTRANERPAIEAALSNEPLLRSRVIFVDLPAPVLALKKLSGTVLPYYMLWQHRALDAARHCHRRERFDLVHNLTFTNFAYPAMAQRVGPPTVFGPLGGGLDMPPGLLEDLPLGVRLSERLRGWGRAAFLSFAPLRTDWARCAQALSCNPETTDALRRLGCRAVEPALMPALAPADIAAGPKAPPLPGEPLRLAAMGVLTPRKGFSLAVRVLAGLRRTIPRSTLDILGRGPERGRLLALGERLGVADALRLVGTVPRAEIFGWLDSRHLFIHTALRDDSPWACAEAAARGLPVLCLRGGGPAAVAGPAAVTAAADGEPALVRGLVEAAGALYADPGRYRSISGEVLKWAAGRLTLTARIDEVCRAYAAAMERGA